MAKQVTARLLQQPTKNFPIDCETLDTLQSNTAVVQVLGNIVGDKAILYGCEPELNGAERRPGYVFLRTRDFPEGEVVWWEGGPVSGVMNLCKEPVSVTAQGIAFDEAYTIRSLRHGSGAEEYSWADFRQYKTPGQLEDEIRTLDQLKDEITTIKTTLDGMYIEPLGIIKMWAGPVDKIPEGYALCDGRSLLIFDYPYLHYAISPTGSGGSHFNLPDLRGRFVVGLDPGDSEYAQNGNTGGSEAVTLTMAQIPQHDHDLHAVNYDTSAQWTYPGDVIFMRESLEWTHKDDRVYSYYHPNAIFQTNSRGSGEAHENRPPYYVLAYIMKLKP